MAANWEKCFLHPVMASISLGYSDYFNLNIKGYNNDLDLNTIIKKRINFVLAISHEHVSALLFLGK